MDQEPRQAFLRVSEIVSIIDEIDGNTTVHMRDGREFCVIASGALECWMHIKDVIDPDLISEEFVEMKNPFVQFALKP